MYVFLFFVIVFLTLTLSHEVLYLFTNSLMAWNIVDLYQYSLSLSLIHYLTLADDDLTGAFIDTVHEETELDKVVRSA